MVGARTRFGGLTPPGPLSTREHIMLESPGMQNRPRHRGTISVQRAPANPFPMLHGQSIVCVHSLGSPREHLQKHASTDRRVTRQETLTGWVSESRFIRQPQRLPLRSPSRPSATMLPCASYAHIVCLGLGAIGWSNIACRSGHDRFAKLGPRCNHSVKPRQ